tara:strand:+ start:4948 stop:6285 length:1338 start_codon:yes stop_codon:yes gene_type:complete
MNKERQILKDAAIKILEDRITEIGSKEELIASNPEASIIGSENFILIPGLINAHQHLTGDRLIQSCIPSNIKDTEAIFDWSVPIHTSHGPEDDEISATLSLAESARRGITFTVEAGTVAFPEMVLRGFETVGVGGTIGSWGWDIGDGPYANSIEGVLERQINVIELTKDHPLVKGWVTLVGHDLMSDQLMQKASNLAKENLTNLTFHLSPHAGDASRYLERTGMRPISYINQLGVLGSHVLIGHAVHIDDAELETLISNKTAIASCPWAYLKLGQGVTQFGKHPEFLSKGGRLSLGCDTENAGDDKDLLLTARLFSGLIQEAKLGLDKPASHYALELITIGGAEALGIDEEIGSIETGKRADIVLIDTSNPSWQPLSPDPVMQLIWGGSSSDVHSVIVGGKIIVENKKCNNFDESALTNAVKSRQENLLKSAGLNPSPYWPITTY